MTPIKLCATAALGVAAGILFSATASAQATVSFPNRTYDIREFGAKMVAAKFLYDTVPIQKAIDTCAKEGGGTVVIPKGNWLTGPLFLRSNVRLVLQRGAELAATTEEALFLKTPETAAWAANTYLATINIADAENVAVVGEGRIDGQGSVWWEKWRAETRATGKRPGANRPRLVFIVRSHNVLFQGVSFYNSPSYHLVFKDCSHITVDHIKITALAHSPNTDAIDPIDTRDMVITNNTIDCGDDVVAIKSSHVDPQHPGASSGNITIANNTVLKGRGISIGSESIGGVRHVLVENNTTYDAMYGIRIKTPRQRGGEVTDIIFHNNRMINVETPFVFSTYYETMPVDDAEVQRQLTDGGFVLNDQIYPNDRDPAQPYVEHKTPDIHDNLVDGLTATGADRVGLIVGLPERPIVGLQMKNLDIQAVEPARVRNADVHFENAKLQAGKGPALSLEAGGKISGFDNGH
jgi:polygalacturonase